MRVSNFDVIEPDERPSIKFEDGRLIFNLPEMVKKVVEEKLNFPTDFLNIEPEPTVAQLIAHLSKQAAAEAYLSSQCAYLKNAIESWKEVHNTWWNTASYKHRLDLMKEHKSRFTEKMLDNFMYKNYQLNILSQKAKIIELETKYRDICGVRDALINKGRYLQTLKNLIEVNIT